MGHIFKDMKKIFVALMLLASPLWLSGCEEQKIFNEEGYQYKLVAVESEDLSVDTFYIKNGTKFYEVYAPAGTAKSAISTQDDDRIFWIEQDYSLIPTYYKNELIAYASHNTSLESVPVERFQDLGYSFGIYGGYLDEYGYYCFDADDNTITGSSAEWAFSKAKSTSIRVESINGEKITESMISSAGTLLGLEYGAEYTVTYYAGTYYSSSVIAADKMFLQSYEIYSIDEAFTTQNGYLSLYLPEDCVSGYYNIGGQGLCKYYAFNKGENDESAVDMNQAYYTSLAEQLSVYSQKYLAVVQKATENVEFFIKYELGKHSLQDIEAVLTAPDNTSYDMNVTEMGISISLAEAMAGNWSINILPKDLTILSIDVNSTELEDEAICEEFEFTIEKDSADVQFYVEYNSSSKKPAVWGMVTNADGNTSELELIKGENMLSCTYAYLPAGNYKVTVYHYNDSQITAVDHQTIGETKTVEIITVTE